MNRRLLLLLAIVAFAAPGLILRAQQQPAQPPQGPPGILRGIVVREGTSEPIRDVRITAGRGINLANTAPLIESALAAGLPAASIESLLNSLSVQAAGGAGVAGGAQQTFSAVTDSEGRFIIEGIPPGQHTVTAQREGFFGPVPNGVNAAIAPAGARGTATITSQQTTEITLTMIPGAAVSGRVLGPNGMPVTNIAVEVLRPVYTNGVRTMQILNQKPSDDRGEYRLFQLPPGEYYLAATPRQIAGVRGAAANSPAQPIEVRTYYPNAIDARNALPIKLKPGDDLNGMNLQLQTLLGAKVSGRVVSLLPANAPVPQTAAALVNRGNNASITLLPRDRNAFVDPRLSLGISASLVSPNDGAFEIPNVPAGAYDVYASVPVAYGWGPAQPPGLATAPVAYGRASIDVRGSDVSGVTISVHQGVDVKGQIFVDGKPALAPVRMGLLPADSSSGIPVFNQVGRGTIAIQQDGSFLIPLVPEATYRPQPTILAGAAITQLMTQLNRGGRGAIAATATPPPTPPPLPANAYVADVRQGGTSVYDDGLSIGTSLVGPLEVQINTNGGALQGTVVGAGQQPHTQGAVVVLMPPVNRRQNPLLYRTASPDAQGTFTINAVLPGPYKLFAWESVPVSAYLNADFMKTYEDRGVSIIVPAGATIAQAVTLIPAEK
jgi:hypothetical protein